MTGVTSAKAIAASLFHTCILTSGGGISCWGDNDKGQLGTCTNKSSATPVAAKNANTGVLTDATAVFAAANHTCALVPGDASERSLVCWGSYSWSQNNNFDATDPCPRVMMPASSVSLASSHACVVSAGDVWCWGSNDHGQAGIASDIPQTKPTKVISGAIGVAAGSSHTCALMHEGTVRCWGAGWAGQLGDGIIHASNPSGYVTAEQSKPIVGLTDVVTLTAGSKHTCALTRAGRIFCWGDASVGQMGDGRGEAGFDSPAIHQTTPVEVVGPF
jgi:alpha-tubulin suppressor-like RCC1 family protein